MKSILKCALSLVVLTSLFVSCFSVALAENDIVMFRTLDEVLEWVNEMDPEAIHEIVVKNEQSYLEVNWSFDLFGYLGLIQVGEEEYICYGEELIKLQLCFAAGISMEYEENLIG